MNLPGSLVDEITELARTYDVDRVVLFGSRARGDAQSRSDIDLAIFTRPSFREKGRLAADMDDLPTLLKIDLVFVDEAIEPGLMKRINQEGVVVYERSGSQIR